MWGWPQEIIETLEIAGDIWDAPPLPRVCTDEGRSYGDVITKFSRLDGKPIFLTDGASHASATLLYTIFTWPHFHVTATLFARAKLSGLTHGTIHVNYTPFFFSAILPSVHLSLLGVWICSGKMWEWSGELEEKRRGGEGMERIVGSATTVQVSLVSG